MLNVVQFALAFNGEGAFMAFVSLCGGPAIIIAQKFGLNPDKFLMKFYVYHEWNLEYGKIIFQKLQGKPTLISQQSLRLEELVNTYTLISEMKDPMFEHYLPNTDPLALSRKGFLKATYAHVSSYLDMLGRWVLVTVNAMENRSWDHLVSCLTAVVFHLAEEIFSIVAERDDTIDAGEVFTAVYRAIKFLRICEQCYYNYMYTIVISRN